MNIDAVSGSWEVYHFMEAKQANSYTESPFANIHDGPSEKCTCSRLRIISEGEWLRERVIPTAGYGLDHLRPFWTCLPKGMDHRSEIQGNAHRTPAAFSCAAQLFMLEKLVCSSSCDQSKRLLQETFQLGHTNWKLEWENVRQRFKRLANSLSVLKARKCGSGEKQDAYIIKFKCTWTQYLMTSAKLLPIHSLGQTCIT